MSEQPQPQRPRIGEGKISGYLSIFLAVLSLGAVICFHFPEFFTSLSRLLELDFETVVFGHGPPGDRAAVRRQIDYYDDLRTAVLHAVAEGLTEDQAADQISLPEYASWVQYEAWLPLNVRAIYRWIAGR